MTPAAAAPSAAAAREAEALRGELATLSRKYALATRALAEQSRALATAAAARESDQACLQQQLEADDSLESRGLQWIFLPTTADEAASLRMAGGDDGPIEAPSNVRWAVAGA